MHPHKCGQPRAARLLGEQLPALRDASARGPILDLACGTGRNGLYLLRHGLPVVFADRADTALQTVAAALASEDYAGVRPQAQLWQVDFEDNSQVPLAPDSYGGIIVFRYLHRPLLPHIMDAVRPGGLLIYETFTVDQAALGRPKNPDFLLAHGELAQTFADWQLLHSFEGEVDSSPGGRPQALAQVVAIKPQLKTGNKESHAARTPYSR